MLRAPQAVLLPDHVSNVAAVHGLNKVLRPKRRFQTCDELPILALALARYEWQIGKLRTELLVALAPKLGIGFWPRGIARTFLIGREGLLRVCGARHDS